MIVELNYISAEELDFDIMPTNAHTYSTVESMNKLSSSETFQRFDPCNQII